MSKIRSESYKTDNFNLASFLIADGCKLLGVKPYPDNDKKFIFCFFSTRLLRNLLVDYYSLKALIQPQLFSNSQKTLKSIIYSNKSTDL